MFKILSGDFEKTAIYSCNQIIESKLNTYLYNAQDIRVLSESEIKEYIYNPDYSKYTKELEKALTGTKIVCFEYKFTNGKSFKAIADLSVFHQIQKSGKKTVDESKLTHNGKKGCLISVISIIIIFIFINTVISSNKPASNSNSKPEPTMEVINLHNCGRSDGISYFCGTVKNTSNTDVQSTYLNFLYYDAKHKIIGDTLQYITDLKAGQSKEFKTPYNIPYAANVRFYRTQSTKY